MLATHENIQPATQSSTHEVLYFIVPGIMPRIVATAKQKIPQTSTKVSDDDIQCNAPLFFLTTMLDYMRNNNKYNSHMPCNSQKSLHILANFYIAYFVNVISCLIANYPTSMIIANHLLRELYIMNFRHMFVDLWD